MDKPSPYQGEDPYVFVCYAHEDAAAVYPEIGWLQSEGVNVWYDEGISAGKNWRAEIGDALDRCERVLFFISKDSLASDHCNREVNYALDENKEIVPVYIENIALTSDLKLGLNRVQALRIADSSYRSALLGALRVGAQRAAAETTANNQKSMHVTVTLVVAVMVVAIAAWLLLRPDSAPKSTRELLVTPSIAVLPFANLSGDAQAESIGEGIAEDLLNRLTRVEGIKVIARTSSFQFRDQIIGVSDIAEQLGVSHVLEGSVRRAGDRLRVTAKLIDPADATPLWSEQFDREIQDVFLIEDEIAGSLANRLRINLGARSNADSPVSLAAYTLVLRAKEVGNRLTKADLGRAVALLEEATSIAPDYVEAWATLAQMHYVTWLIHYDGSPARRAAAQSASRRAISLDPEHALAKQMLARTLLDNGEWLAAFSMINEALEDGPADSDVAGEHAYMLAMVGRIEEALTESRRALELDPLNPARMYAHGLILLFSGAFQQAIEFMERAGAMGLDAPWLYADLSLAYYYANDEERAFKHSLKNAWPEAIAGMQESFETDGYLGAMKFVQSALVRQSGDPCLPFPWGSAFTAALLEEPVTMFQCLRVAAQQGRVLHLMGHRHFHQYRSDPRFLEILELTGLDQVVDPALLVHRER